MKKVFDYNWIDMNTWVDPSDTPEIMRRTGLLLYNGKWELYITPLSKGARVRYGFYMDMYNCELRYKFDDETSVAKQVFRGWISSKEEFDQLIEDFEISTECTT